MKRTTLGIVGAILIAMVSQIIAGVIITDPIEDDGTWTTGPTQGAYLVANNGLTPTAGEVTMHLNNGFFIQSGTNFITYTNKIVAGVYEVSIDVGSFTNRPFATVGAIGLTADGKLLPTFSASMPTPASGQFETWKFSYRFSPSDTNINKNIGFTLSVPYTGASQNVAFDNLRIEYSPQADTTYDAATAFATNSNPNGVWTYGYSTNLGSTLNLFTERGTDYDLIFWRSNILYAAPSVYYNPTDATITPNTVSLAAKQLGFHPGPNGEYAVIRFTAPTTTQYQVSSSFVGADIVGTTTDVHVLTNGVPVFNGNVSGFGPGTGPSYTNVFSLSAGETLDFAVGRGDDGDFGSDLTGIEARIVEVSLPLPLLPPILTCPESASLECDTTAQIGVTVGSPSGASVNVVWKVNGQAIQTNSVPAGVAPTSSSLMLVTTLPIGTNIVEAVATDSFAQVTSCHSQIVVRDTTAPTIFSASARPNILWPPNHKMVQVSLSALVGDNCGVVTWKIAKVTCSEPTKSADWIITGAHTLLLRAERAGKLRGRTYSITLKANDGHGNTSSKVVNVRVP